MKKSSMKPQVLLTLMLIFVLILTACNNKELPEDSSIVSTPPIDSVSEYIFIGEIKSSNEYLQNESNNIKVYGKNKDNLGNYTEIKFLYKDKEWISDEVRIFADKEMEREDTRQFHLSLYEDKDIISVIYYEKIASDEIKENMLFFHQQSFMLLNLEDLNISIRHQASTEKVIVQNNSYDMQAVIKSKIDPEIFDQKVIIGRNKRDEPHVEIFAIKKDDNNNYNDIYIDITSLDRVIHISGRKQFAPIALGSRMLDVNGDGNDEIIIIFSEKTEENEIIQSVCFVDINTGREMNLYDLGLENIVEVSYETDTYTTEIEDKIYKVIRCHYTRKNPINEKNYDLVMLKELKCRVEEKDICLSILNDPISYITENGKPLIFVLQMDNKIKFYDGWTMPKYSEISQYDTSVDIQLMDVNDDGVSEIVMTMYIGGGTGASGTDLHIINSSSMEEIVTLNNWDVGLLLRSYVDSRVYIENKEVKLDFYINDDMNNKYSYTFDYSENISYFDFLGYASLINYVLLSDKNQIIVQVSAAIGINQSAGYFEAKITLVDNDIVFSGIQFIINNGDT